MYASARRKPLGRAAMVAHAGRGRECEKAELLQVAEFDSQFAKSAG